VTERVVGIDVGARLLHCASLGADGRALDWATVPSRDSGALAAWCAGAAVVAIDAPRAPSTAPHADSADLAPKFRAARCAEIELGRRHGSWVSWVCPAAPPFPGWIVAGFGAFAALDGPRRPELLEVYPYACFRDLAGGRRLAPKQTASGREARAKLLARAGLKGGALRSSSHDTLDALAAARVALDRLHGGARRVSCGHDDSAIWLPRRRG
jgi:predicted nuclease with RNAse H fold